LLIDVSRSPSDPKRWSDITADLNPQQQEQLHDRQFAPYLNALRQRVADAAKRQNHVLHLSIRTHTGTPGGPIPIPDIALVFNPLRPTERYFAQSWLELLRAAAPDLRLAANEPHDGSHHGLLNHLRALFPDPNYAAITLSVNQSMFLEGKPWRWDKLKKLITDTLPEALNPHDPAE
jgi:predicted N-formylglutamate amidohydrolase